MKYVILISTLGLAGQLLTVRGWLAVSEPAVLGAFGLAIFGLASALRRQRKAVQLAPKTETPI